MIVRNQMCAASVLIRGCQAIKYLNVPSTAGAPGSRKEGFDPSNSAMRLGVDGLWSQSTSTHPNNNVFEVPLVGVGIWQPAESQLVPAQCSFADVEEVALFAQEFFVH
jgi:hypothetical protein